MSKLAILGLGAMGSRMAAVLLSAGHDITVWNRSKVKAESLIAAGAKLADTPALAAASADVVISMVRDDEASRTVWLHTQHGALAAMQSSAIAVECTTLTVDWVRSLGQFAAAQGIAFVDAPLAGSRPQAESKQLIFFAGGNDSAISRLIPVLTEMGRVHRVGPTGCGAAVKLAVNALFGTQVALMAELMGLLTSCGVDLSKAIDVIGETPVASPSLKIAAIGMLSGIGGGGFKPMFPLELVDKDFGYVGETARSFDCSAPIIDAASAVFAKAVESGFAKDHITGVIQMYINGKDPPPAIDPLTLKNF